VRAKPGNVGRAILGGLARLLRKKDGNVAPLIALLIVPIVGALAVGGETSSWFTMQRSQQNAADSAVLAAALKGGASYATEAQGVSATYGYKNGGNIVVTPTTVTCPTGAAVLSGTTCYRVSINRTVPVYLTKVVGYRGDGTLVGGASGKLISANAIAGTISGTRNFCLIGLNSLTLSGGNGTNLTGCELLTGGNMACNGTNSDFGVAQAYAGGTNQNCGDPVSVAHYAGFPGDTEAATVTANINALAPLSCATTTLTITSLPSGVSCFSPTTGTLKLGANLVVTNPDTVLVLKNSSLNLQNFKLSTAAGASLTIVYTGATGAATSTVLQSSGGSLDVAGPSGGSWKGMVFIEDPALTGQQITVPGAGRIDSRDLNFSGNGQSITINITGLIYAPNAEVNISGGIDHASNSDHGTGTYDRCVGIIANTITFSGTNAMLSNPTAGCHDAGLNLPTVPMVALLH
jgi:Flp pilus assembly protein TadG